MNLGASLELDWQYHVWLITMEDIRSLVKVKMKMTLDAWSVKASS